MNAKKGVAPRRAMSRDSHYPEGHRYAGSNLDSDEELYSNLGGPREMMNEEQKGTPAMITSQGFDMQESLRMGATQSTMQGTTGRGRGDLNGDGRADIDSKTETYNALLKKQG